MTDKDREQYFEVLLALGGYNKFDKEEQEKYSFACQSICQPNAQKVENTDSQAHVLWVRIPRVSVLKTA